ncbi:hypothetical protein [Bradyrhizobium roseum]|uniref:hypothetical protein n=1 Tax=Bradyrhizobium roseum TaxID=3056648 RepID=UPI002634E90A|nr:hypothetical protein [Bradyrhizobium roseus]WKA28265.1 hypothetical protein QUH67_32775 [Bradyrhizobium roseus]
MRETMAQPQRTAVIMEGGIGGLFAANALIAHGFDVFVDEQALAALYDRGPVAFLAYEQLRRWRVAAVQSGARVNGMRYDSSCADLGVRDAEITAPAAFRRRLYDQDVVPEAQAVAAALG